MQPQGSNKMKAQNEIEYEINFIKNELVNKDFQYLTEGELKAWESALNWTLKTGAQKWANKDKTQSVGAN